MVAEAERERSEEPVLREHAGGRARRRRFSFYETRLQHVGVVTARAETAPKPDFGTSRRELVAGGLVGRRGVHEAREAASARRITSDASVHCSPPKYSPLQANGNSLQSVYLAEIPEELADLLIDLAEAAYPDVSLPTEPEPPAEAVAEEEAELANLQGRTDIGDVERSQLVKARRGQGIFRTNVRMNETRCRVTGVTDPPTFERATSSRGRTALTPKRWTAAMACCSRPTSTISSTGAGSRLQVKAT